MKKQNTPATSGGKAQNKAIDGLKESVAGLSRCIEGNEKEDLNEGALYLMLIVRAMNRFAIKHHESGGVMKWPDNKADVEDVFADFEWAKQLKPGWPFAYEWEAFHCVRVADARGQQRALWELVRNNPDYHLTDLYHAELLMLENRPAEAYKHADRAAALSPDSLWAHGLRARAATAMGRRQQATAAEKRFKLLCRCFPKRRKEYSEWKERSDQADRDSSSGQVCRVIEIPEGPHLPEVKCTGE